MLRPFRNIDAHFCLFVPVFCCLVWKFFQKETRFFHQVKWWDQTVFKSMILGGWWFFPAPVKYFFLFGLFAPARWIFSKAQMLLFMNIFCWRWRYLDCSLPILFQFFFSNKIVKTSGGVQNLWIENKFFQLSQPLKELFFVKFSPSCFSTSQIFKKKSSSNPDQVSWAPFDTSLLNSRDAESSFLASSSMWLYFLDLLSSLFKRDEGILDENLWK